MKREDAKAYVEFYGAAGEVTGSLHRVQVGDATIALDCGLFQGHRAQANRQNRQLPRWAVDAHALVLSHAHIDHSGNIPGLVKAGFTGNIYCTPTSVIVYFDEKFNYQGDALPIIDRINAAQHRIPWMENRLLVLSVRPDAAPRAGP